MKGNSNNLMKVTSKRRRPKAQIALEKKQAEEREANIAKRLAQMDELEQQLQAVQVDLDQRKALEVQVQGLFNQGKMMQDSDKILHIVENPLEQQLIILSHNDDDESQIKAAAIRQELETQKIQTKMHQVQNQQLSMLDDQESEFQSIQQ